VNGAENGTERAENRLERSGERAKSAAQNPLHHKTTQSDKLKSISKVATKLSVKIYYYFVCCVENKSDYLANGQSYHFSYAHVMVWAMLSVYTISYAQTGPNKSLVTDSTLQFLHSPVIGV